MSILKLKLLYSGSKLLRPAIQIHLNWFFPLKKVILQNFFGKNKFKKWTIGFVKVSIIQVRIHRVCFFKFLNMKYVQHFIVTVGSDYGWWFLFRSELFRPDPPRPSAVSRPRTEGLWQQNRYRKAKTILTNKRCSNIFLCFTTDCFKSLKRSAKHYTYRGYKTADTVARLNHMLVFWSFFSETCCTISIVCINGSNIHKL